jgi:hypothetical protein
VAITGGFNGGCIDLAADLNNQVSSFGPGEYLAPSPTSRRSHPMFPDPGQICQLFKYVCSARAIFAMAYYPPYSAHNCATSGEGVPAWSGPIAFPGIKDFSVSWVDTTGFVNAPFNDIISSYMQRYLSRVFASH